MNPDILQVFHIVEIVSVAFLVIVTIGFFCFVFPKKCDKCGKYLAYISSWINTASPYTGGGYMVSGHLLSQKRCLSCGFESKPKLEHVKEYMIRE